MVELCQIIDSFAQFIPSKMLDAALYLFYYLLCDGRIIMELWQHDGEVTYKLSV